MRSITLKKLTKLADKLDRSGLGKIASEIDKIIETDLNSGLNLDKKAALQIDDGETVDLLEPEIPVDDDELELLKEIHEALGNSL